MATNSFDHRLFTPGMPSFKSRGFVAPSDVRLGSVYDTMILCDNNNAHGARCYLQEKYHP